jgi:hypothetical protein
MNKAVEAHPFTLVLANGDVLEYPKTESEEYHWSLTPSGDLLIYRKTIHAQFSAVIADERIKAIAAGHWVSVDVIEEEETVNVDTAIIN